MLLLFQISIIYFLMNDAFIFGICSELNLGKLGMVHKLHPWKKVIEEMGNKNNRCVIPRDWI